MTPGKGRVEMSRPRESHTDLIAHINNIPLQPREGVALNRYFAREALRQERLSTEGED